MSINLLELTSGALGDDFVQLASSLFGEDAGKIGKGISALEPAVLGGIVQKGSTPEGAQGLLTALDSVPTDLHLPEPFGKQLATPESRDELQQIGHNLLEQLFGDKVDELANAVSSVSGIGRAVSGHAGEQAEIATGNGISHEVSGGLLTLVTPAIFSVIKKVVDENKLDARGLSQLLSEQHDTLQSALSPQLASVLGFGSAAAFLGSLTGKFTGATQDVEAQARAIAAKVAEPVSTVVAETGRSPRRWWPWALLALVVLAAFPLLSSKPSVEKATPTVDETASGGGSEASMASAPASTASAPMATTASAPASSAAGLAKVYFATGKADIDTDGQQAIKSAVDAVKSAGGSVDVTGYTDKTGDLHANEELAKKRALAVKDALLAAGLADSQIHMKPPQSVTGGGNDKEARRVEIAPAQ